MRNYTERFSESSQSKVLSEAPEEGDIERSRRDLEDQNRDRAVYEYLLTLTDLEVTETKRGRVKDSSAKPNESSIAKQWGIERIFVRRVLRSVLHDKYYANEPEQPVPGLTLGKLIKILSGLQEHWENQRAVAFNGKVPRILTRTEKLRALQKFFQLSVAERATLKLPIHSGEVLLQRLLEDATDPIKGISAEAMTQLYKTFLRDYASATLVQDLERHRPSDSDRKALIKEIIRDTVVRLIGQYFDGLEEKRKQDKIHDFIDKVEREISRIEFQAGIKQAEDFLGKKLDEEIQRKYTEYLTLQFIQRLTRSVVENEILTDEFPIHFKYCEIEKVRPLPLYVKKAGQESGLLNPELLEVGEDEDSINGLERQFAYKVKVHFYIKLPDNYTAEFSDVTVVRDALGCKRLDFFEETSGIGSPIAHIVSVINRVLFWDIPLLKAYLPIPSEVLNTDECLGSSHHGPIWSYKLVRLYKVEDINRAIAENMPCEQIAESSEIAYGEFCGSDLIEVSANAALHARLRLIKQIGVNPKQYLQELCHRISELDVLKQAKSYLHLYPFSLRAMEGRLESTIFKNRYRIKHKDFNFISQESEKPWSLTACEAHLDIAEANLKEGLYRVAKRYLDAIKPYFDQDDTCFLGTTILAKYHCCWFRYDYLCDLEDPDRAYPDRYQAVRSAERRLEEAQKCLDSRLEKFYQLNELPQSNFHPHFHLLARIHADRAKLHLFFPAYTRQLSQWHSLLEPVRLLEKARIYAARDGSPTFYAQWTAYQSWCYLMVAYLGDQNQFATKELSRENCIDWARRLIDHALHCYAPTGKTCYQQIKDNGGKATPEYYDDEYCPDSETQPDNIKQGHPRTKQERRKYYESYGRTKVQVVPLIQELNGELNGATVKDEQSYEAVHNVLTLDTTILKKIHGHESNSVYLFGSISSIILFAMGMLQLCQDYTNPRELAEAIERRALRMFTYCWAIAADGTQRNSKHESEDALILDRAFVDEDDREDGQTDTDLLLRGLYPHRLTQFSDLGRIFMAVCKLLLIVHSNPIAQYYNQKQSWNAIESIIQPQLTEISKLIDELRLNNKFPTPEILGQQRYNGHLAEHFKNIDQYFNQFIKQLKSRQLKSIDLVKNRDKIVADIFQIIRGESNIAP